MTFTDRENFIFGMGILRGLAMMLGDDNTKILDLMSELSSRIETKLLPKNDLIDTEKLLIEVKESNHIIEMITDTLEEVTQELDS